MYFPKVAPPKKFVVCYLGVPDIASLSFGKFAGGVGQLVAVCGLFLWGGKRIAETGGVAGVSRLWRR